MRTAWAAAILLVLAGCAATPTPTPTPPPEPSVTSPLSECTGPRPQVCTMEYAPVCAQLASGGMREYASGCNACADDAVTGFLPGPCAQ